MKKILITALLVATVLWALYALVLLGILRPAILPPAFLALTLPTTVAEFGQAFSALEGLISSLALMLGLIAVVIQSKHSADANLIGALTARQQFLVADCDRLENDIQRLKKSINYDHNTLRKMSGKKSRQLDEADAIAKRLNTLITSPEGKSWFKKAKPQDNSH
ncbi:MAG: hypothetical protein RBQ99_04660 [Trichlorobacter sp.]|nr:hypothetical protein [Trichlorobacter sp.]